MKFLKFITGNSIKSFKHGGITYYCKKGKVFKTIHERGNIISYYNEDGKLHREYGPAIFYSSSGQETWYNQGKIHRTDGPALIGKDCIEYWQNDLRHRENGPAIIFNNGRKEYWVNGKKHRENGPAVIDIDGTEQYWVNGRRIYNESLISK